MGEREDLIRQALIAQARALQSMSGGVANPRQANLDRIASAKAGTLQVSPDRMAAQSQIDQSAADRMTLSAPGPGGAITKAIQGIPFVGEFSDEITGMVGRGLERVGAVSPGTGDRARDNQRAVQDAYAREFPGRSMAASLTGGIVAGIPMGAALGAGRAAEFIGRGGSALMQGARAAGVGAVAGGTEGAVSGFGAGTDGNRAQAAKSRGTIGAAFGGALGPFAVGLGVGAAALAKRIKKLDVTSIANEFGLSPESARVMRRYLLNDDLDAASRVMARGGDDAMLANAGPSTRQAMDTAMSTGGEALAVGRRRIGDATEAASGKLLTTIDDILGTADGGIRGASRAASQASAPARKAAYDFTYNQPRPMVGPTAERIDGVLARISPADMQAAIKAANRAMLNDGRVNQNIVATIAEDGSVTYARPLSVMHLDYIKRGLRSMVTAETDLKGAVSDAGRIFKSQSSDLGNALKGDVGAGGTPGIPGYSAAMRIGGDNALAQEGLDLGRRLLNDKTTVEDVRLFLRGGVSDEVRASVKKGFRENLDEVMGRARSTIGQLEDGAMDFETGMNASAEAITAVRNMLTRNNMTKARFVLGSDAKRLFGEMEKMTDALVLRAAVAKGSATAIRRAGQQQMSDEVGPGLVRQTLGDMGSPLDALRGITRAAAGTDTRSISAAEATYFAEIADALTRIRGPEAQRALDAVKRAMAGQPLKDAEAQLIGRFVSGGVGLGGQQLATQNLSQR